MNRLSISICTSLVVLAVACEDDKTNVQPPATTAVPAASVSSPKAASAMPPASAMPAASSASSKESPVPPGAARFAVVTGKGTFVIDAPLEKIKGMTDEVRGHLDVNPKELAKSAGEIMVRLSTLKTSTFDSADKNTAQTEHARNWMEVGNDSPAASRMKYEWATFTVRSLVPAPAALADAKEEAGVRVVKATASGDLDLHGVTSKKTVSVTLRFKGPADAPTEVDLLTDAPMPVSMKEHGVMPRDTLGGLLNGALDRIGKKIDDKVQVTFEAAAKASMPAQP